MKNRRSKIIVIIFWLIILFYLDPGGFLTANLIPIERTVYNLFTLVTAITLWRISILNVKINIFSFKFVRYYAIVIFLWNLYFFIVYVGYNSNEEFSGIIVLFLRNNTMVLHSLIVFPIVYFYFLGIDYFIELLIYTTILIGFAFIITVLFNIPLVPTWDAQRRQIEDTTRVFMYGYGLMNFIIPFAISNYFFQIRVQKKILLASVIVFSIILITVYRRDMVSVIEYIFIISVLSAFIERKKIIKSIFKYLNFRVLIVLGFFVLIISLFKPSVIKNTGLLFENTLIEVGLLEREAGFSKRKDVRMSLLGNVHIVRAIKNNFFIGTGFDKNWYTGDGGKNKWEGADYVFLATFGMYGIVGLLIFLPFYFLTFRVTFLLLHLLKSNLKNIYNNKYLIASLLIGVSVSSEFIKNIIEYPNWFYPIGAIPDRGKYFIFFGLLVGSYYYLKFELKRINAKIEN